MLSTYKILISEPFNYSGPNPIFGFGIGVIFDSEGKQYFLLNLKSSIQIEEGLVNQLVVHPRYIENNINEILQGTCVVAIYKMKLNTKIDLNKSFNFPQIDYFAIGTITKEQE